MEITIDDKNVTVKGDDIINIGNGWKAFEYSNENSPAPKLYYFNPSDENLKAITFDEYVSLLTEGETIEGMLNKLNLKIDEYCDKQPDPKPKLCTDKDKLQEFKPDEENEEDKQNDIIQETQQETQQEKPDSDKNDVIIESFLKKYPGMKNIMKIIENKN